MRFSLRAHRAAAPCLRLLAAVALAGTAAIFPALPRPALAQNAVLRVDPFEGHSGATVFVSGSGFEPLTQLNLLIACPSWDNPTAAALNNVDLETGPVTDANGDFAGWPFPNFRLHGVQQSLCRVYANYVHAFNVSDFPAYYTIVAPHVRLPARARLIEGTVKVHPKQVKSGLQERINITNGWGGAVAAYSVTYPHLTPVSGHVRLDSNGSKSFRIKVPVGHQPGLARVKVHFSLGQTRGATSAAFRIVR